MEDKNNPFSNNWIPSNPPNKFPFFPQK
jgi:hypothetical protein